MTAVPISIHISGTVPEQQAFMHLGLRCPSCQKVVRGEAVLLGNDLYHAAHVPAEECPVLEAAGAQDSAEQDAAQDRADEDAYERWAERRGCGQ